MAKERATHHYSLVEIGKELQLDPALITRELNRVNDPLVRSRLNGRRWRYDLLATLHIFEHVDL